MARGLDNFWGLFKKKENGIPAVGQVRFGDMRRLSPFSQHFGFDRGGPVDRYYMEKFLTQYAADIKGRALEVKDDSYSKEFGGSRITQMDILDIDSANPKATVIADLTKADNIAANTYDCIVLTQVLQFIYDLKAAFKRVHRILKPGGVLLLTVPGISHMVYERYGDSWCWCFTKHSVQTLLKEAFKPQNIEVQTHGNVLVAASFLYGMSSKELTQQELDHTDPDYQVLLTARAVKE